MEFDKEIYELLDTAFFNKTDVFLKMRIPEINKLYSPDIRTAVFLPGSFSDSSYESFWDIREINEVGIAVCDKDFIVADIRYLNKEYFRQFLIKNRFGRLILLFSECSDISEYGYRESYFRAGEIRSEADYYCQLVAFFSPVINDVSDFREYFGCESLVIAGEDCQPDFTSLKLESSFGKFRQTALEAEKSACRKTCIYFNSRSEARDFASFLSRRGTPFCYLDGSMKSSEKRKMLDSFRNGECCILLVTKAFINESIFYSCDKCIICGVPFSPAHLYRCTYASSDRSVDIIFCEDDFVRNEKIIRSFALKTEVSAEYYQRPQKLLEIKNLLKRG